MLLRTRRCLPAALSRAAVHPRVSPALPSPGPPRQHGPVAVANQGSGLEPRSGPIDWVRGSTMARGNPATLLPASTGGHYKVGVQARWFSSAGLPPHMVIGMPALSPTMNQGNITKWRKQEGDKIEVGDVICEIETDKATLEFETLEEGYLAKILVREGSKDVQVGQPIYVTVEESDDIEKIPADTSFGGDHKEDESSESAAQTVEVDAAEQSPAMSRISPAAKMLIKEHGLNASLLKASGPRGTLLKGDVLAALKSGTALSSAKEKTAPAAPSPQPARDSQVHSLTTSPKSDTFEDITNTQIRKVIAKRLLESKQTTPHLYLSKDVILDPLLAFRNELKEQHGVKVSVNDIVIKAVALALRNVPEANAYWDNAKEEAQKCDSVDISIAVATEKGLMTPIIRNADQKTISAISSEVKQLAEKARAGKLAPNEFQGGTFSISNLGMYPVDHFCAIINPPQAGILAVGRGNKVVGSSPTPVSAALPTHRPDLPPFLVRGSKGSMRIPPMAGLTKILLPLILLSLAAAASPSSDAEAVSRFQEYLRIDTAQPTPDYAAAAAFLRDQAAAAGLEARTLELAAGKPLLLLRWPGRRPSLPSILLNSHTDVVPSEPKKWEHAPLSATLDEASGRIYARGSQDMKCVGMQYLEAIRRLRNAGFVPDRNIYITFVPDEEIGGHEGVELFVASKEFKELNVGLVLDEGLASPGEEYRVFYAERSPWWLTIKAKGAPGHGAKLYDGSAMENLMRSVEALRRFRTAQFDLVKSGEKAEGDVVSVNFAYLKAGTPTPTGFVMNLQPSEAEVGIDIRIPPSVHTEALEKRLVEEWAPSSRNLTFEFKQKGSVLDKLGKPAMTIADSSNPWWPVFEEAVKRGGGKLGKPEIFPASTDARYFREIGVPAFGFSPMANTPILLHDHNEFLSKDEYLQGIGIYESIIKALATHKDDGIDKESRAEL